MESSGYSSKTLKKGSCPYAPLDEVLYGISITKLLKFGQIDNLQLIDYMYQNCENSGKICKFATHQCTKFAENFIHVSGTSQLSTSLSTFLQSTPPHRFDLDRIFYIHSTVPALALHNRHNYGRLNEGREWEGWRDFKGNWVHGWWLDTQRTTLTYVHVKLDLCTPKTSAIHQSSYLLCCHHQFFSQSKYWHLIMRIR